MSDALYRAMLSKVKALLKVESSHSKEERASQQWQLLFDIGDTQFILGKGGVNTTFYKVGNGQRKLCYPDELIAFLESLIKKKYATYAICDATGKIKKHGILSEEEALSKKAPVGYYIVATDNGKKVRLYVRRSGVFDADVWQPYQSKKKT